MNTHRDGLARSAQTRLARHAKAIHTDPNLVLTRYAVERFLYRLSRSPHVDRFVLKGALLRKNGPDAPPLDAVVVEIRRFLAGPLASARQKVSS